MKTAYIRHRTIELAVYIQSEVNYYIQLVIYVSPVDLFVV